MPESYQDIVKRHFDRTVSPVQEATSEPSRVSSQGGFHPLSFILEQLSRPGYAATNALYDFTKGERDPFNLIESAGKGFMLNNPKSGYDIMNINTADMPDWQKRALGFGIDVITDPLNLIPIGMAGKIGKLAKVDKFIEPIAKSSVGRKIGTIFNADYNLSKDFPEVYKSAKQLADNIAGVKRLSADEARQIVSLVPNESRLKALTGLIENNTPEELNKLIATGTHLPENERKALQLMHGAGQYTEQELINRGRLKGPWSQQNMSTPGRVRHFLVNAGESGVPIPGEQITPRQFITHPIQSIEQYLGGPSKNITGTVPSSRGSIKAKATPKSLAPRMIPGTIEDINLQKAIQRFGGDSPSLAIRTARGQAMVDKGWKYFEPNAAIVHGMSQAEAKSGILAHDFIVDTIEKYGVKPKRVMEGGELSSSVPAGFRKIEHIKSMPITRGIALPEQVADVIDRVGGTYLMGKDQGVKEVIKIWDDLNNAWKGTALFSPAYHFRNFIGNLWNNYLGGIGAKDVGLYIDTAKLQRVARNPEELRKIVFKTPAGELNGEQIINLARHQNILGTGWAGSDIAKSMQSTLENVAGYAKTPGGKALKLALHPLETNRLAGTMIEDNARLTHFIKKLKEGASPIEAGDSVKKFLFDYNDLSEAEKGIFKRIIPFYTWSRKNIPLQLEQLVNQPAKFGRIEKATRAIKSKEEYGQHLPPYLQEQSAIPLPPVNKKSERRSAFSLENWLPAYDINKIAPRKGASEFLSGLSPFIKIPLQGMTNYDIYRGQPMERFPGESVPGWFGPVGRRWGGQVQASFRPGKEAMRAKEGLSALLSGEPSGWSNIARILTGIRSETYNPREAMIKEKNKMPQLQLLQQAMNKYQYALKMEDNPSRKSFYNDQINRLKEMMKKIVRGEDLGF